MNRQFTSYFIEDLLTIKEQVLNYSKRFSTFSFLENHNYNFRKSYDCVAGAGVASHFITSGGAYNFETLDWFIDNKRDWIFGHVSYDVKNKIEELSSSNFDGVKFPQILFFVPEIVFIFSTTSLQIGVFPTLNADSIFTEIISTENKREGNINSPAFNSRFTKEEYIKTIEKLKEHILKGDCYEINFCQEFYALNITIEPVEIYKRLNVLSPNPFAAFYKCDDKFLICASPERFLKKDGNVLISQPIKGTAGRIFDDDEADSAQKTNLYQNQKERSENIMIIDLVRNDLAKVCKEGSVKVEEFLGVYTFPQVHQLISTISGILKDATTFSQILCAMFPMGSMTGAPKKKVMELIEKYERTARGLFSGTVGYIDPEGNFDFNVVIRSLQYNSSNHYLSISAGSAITFNSIPLNEYDECLLKISAMKKALA
ncbi:MAG: anthranilate synthase component I family protein [Ginsengibacter sp.]